MKRVIFILVILFFSLSSSAQFPVSTDSLYVFIKSNSILRNTVDWKQLDKAYYKQIKDAKSISDTMKSFVSVLRELNDVHSQIFLNNKLYGNYPVFDDTTLAWLKPLNDQANSRTNQIHTEVLSGKIGYIRVPSIHIYETKQINVFAQSLADSVNGLVKKSMKGYIIDLRLNGGGNIYPMLAGLSMFLGNRTIAYETDVNDSVARTWEIQNGNFVIGGYRATDISVVQKAKLLTVPIIVLIGPITKSSGSITAIAFKGRPNTTFIGEPTADGYTTSNGYFQFAPNLTLNFATNYVADRNMNIYKTTVNPDLPVYHGDNFEDLTKDKKIRLAIKQLRRK